MSEVVIEQFEQARGSTSSRLVSGQIGRRWFDVGFAVFVIFWIALLIAGESALFKDPGTFWHTVVGRQILDSGTFVRHDSFTFTKEGESWIAHQWLGDVVLALLDRLGGRNAQLLATTALLAAFYTWVMMRICRSGLNRLVAITFVVLIVAASVSHFHVRPHLATIVGIGVSFAILCDVDSGRKSLRYLAWLVPLTIVWTNIHGGVLAGLADIGFVFAGWLILSFTRYPVPVRTNRDRLWVVGLGLACILSVFCNPYGWKLPETWIKILSLSLPNIIEEHAPLKWTDSTGLFAIIWFVFYLLTIAGLLRLPFRYRASSTSTANRYFTKLPHVTWLLPLVWFYLAASRVRNTPLFAVIVGITVAEVLPATRWREWLEERGWMVARVAPESISRRATLRRCGIAAGVIVSISSMVTLTDWAKLSATVWPLDLLPELTRLNRNAPQGTRIFNSMHDGGFLEFYCPRLKVFIDDRCELFGETMLTEYADAERNHPERIDAWQKKYQFQTALVRNDTPFDQFLKANRQWQRVRRGECDSLYRIIEVPAMVQNHDDEVQW